MDYFYTSWNFMQDKDMPILEIRGSCEKENTEGILIEKAVSMIDMARKFKGIPCMVVNKIRVRSKKEKVVVQFALIFPNDRWLERFVLTITNSH